MSKLYTLQNYTPCESIGFLLKCTYGQLATKVDRALAEFEMTHAQLGIFLRLFHGQAKTAAELARDMMVDTGAMTRTLSRLEAKQFIKRVRSQEDKRVVQVTLTKKGQQLASHMTQVAIDVLNHHLRGFTMKELEQLKGFLRRMIEND